MLQIRKNVELRALTTMGVSATAAHFIELGSVEATQRALAEINQYPAKLVLGGGSNILFVGDFKGLIIFPQIFGIKLIEENAESVRVSVGASENWHQWVLQSTKNGWYGLENLALIPGTVGAAPVQNIGAYGVEVKQVIHQVECFDLKNGTTQLFTNEECQFDYRDSIFKRAGQGRYLVTRVEFNLSKVASFNLSYQPLADYFADKNRISADDVVKRVCHIRQQKLPDPKVLANAGSFFKNPIVSGDLYRKLKQNYPGIVAYPNGDDYKLAAGWLIDNAGLKGHRVGNVGVHQHQALVLVNYGEADGSKINELACYIQQVILEKYGVSLEVEVRVEGFAAENG